MKKILLTSAILFAMLIPAVPSSTNGYFVLCYHALKAKKDMFSFSQEQFRDQMQRLKKAGFTFISFDDVKNNRVTGTKNILVTIDDGNESVYSAYYSIMKPLGIKPVLGIYPAIIGKMKYAMTWDQLTKLKNEGCYIAAHGYNHMYLSSKYYKEDTVQFKKEIYLSKQVLEKKLGITIDAMIYPFGVSSEEAYTMMRDAGYTYGFCLDQKMAAVPAADNFKIPRYMLTKPNQKGIIAFMIKTGDNPQNIANTPSEKKESVHDEKKAEAGQKDRVTIRNYPEKLKELVVNDVVFEPEKKAASKKRSKNSKSNLKNGSKTSKNAKNAKTKNKKIKYFPSKENKKMTDSESKKNGKKHSFLEEVRDYYLTLLSRAESWFTAFRELAWAKLELIKQKTSSLFS